MRTLITICSVFLFFFFYKNKHVFQLIYSIESILTSYKNAFTAAPCAARVTLEVNNNNMHLKFSDFAAAARFGGRQ